MITNNDQSGIDIDLPPEEEPVLIKNSVGRPTKYKPSFCRDVYKLCLLGATMDKIADFFEVNIDSLYEWMNCYPKFSESIKKGRAGADMEVANSMYNKSRGFVQKVKKALVVSDGKDCGSHVEIVEVEQYIPPSEIAGMFWLKNRQKDNWKPDKELNCDDDENMNSVEPVQVNINFKDCSKNAD